MEHESEPRVGPPPIPVPIPAIPVSLIPPAAPPRSRTLLTLIIVGAVAVVAVAGVMGWRAYRLNPLPSRDESVEEKYRASAAAFSKAPAPATAPGNSGDRPAAADAFTDAEVERPAVRKLFDRYQAA